jgi:glycosyltransferase involved in cell wall biosynthesis
MKIAILIPVYNDETGLLKTLKLLEDEKLSLEIIIVAEGKMSYILPEYCGKNKITLIKLEDKTGLENSLNAGLQKAFSLKCDLIARLDAGDEPLKERFQSQLKVMELNQGIGLVGVHASFETPKGEHLFNWKPPHEKSRLLKFMHLQNPFVHSGVMYRAETIRQVGLYKHKTPSAEDYDLFFRISKVSEIFMIPKILMKCELNPKGLSIRKRKEQVGSIIKIKLRYFNPFYIESYVGLIRGSISYVVPFNFLTRVKSILWK